jgi:hypothetical protein
MRILSITKIVLLISLVCSNAFASSDKEMQELFDNYDDVTKYHNTDIVEDVFTKNFLKENGGKEKFIEKVKSAPKQKKKKGLGLLLKKWKKSKVGKFFSAKGHDDDNKSPSPEFIIKEEDGKLKIDGTISDG